MVHKNRIYTEQERAWRARMQTEKSVVLKQIKRLQEKQVRLESKLAEIEAELEKTRKA